MTQKTPYPADRIVVTTSGDTTHASLNEHIRRGGKELRNANVPGLTVAGLKLKGWNCVGANLEGASFKECEIEECNFSGANLTGAVFSGSTIESCNFSEAILDEASFDKVEIWCSQFVKTRAHRSDFTLAVLIGNQILHSQFDGCTLSYATFAGPLTFQVTRLSSKPHTVTVPGQGHGCIRNSSFKNITAVGTKFGCFAPMAAVDKYEWTVWGVITNQPEADYLLRVGGLTFDGVDFSEANISEAKFSTWDAIGSTFEGYASRFRQGVREGLIEKSWVLKKSGNWSSKSVRGGTSLANCIFDRSDVSGATFVACDLRTSSFLNATITNTQFADCFYSETTGFPPGFQVPDSASFWLKGWFNSWKRGITRR